MSHDQSLARRIVLETISTSAADTLDLAKALMGKVPHGQEYFAARLAVSQLLAERLIDSTAVGSAEHPATVYHITGKTPVEVEHKLTDTIKRQRALERKPA